jgi:hypothetical protein
MKLTFTSAPQTLVFNRVKSPPRSVTFSGQHVPPSSLSTWIKTPYQGRYNTMQANGITGVNALNTKQVLGNYKLGKVRSASLLFIPPVAIAQTLKQHVQHALAASGFKHYALANVAAYKTTPPQSYLTDGPLHITITNMRLHKHNQANKPFTDTPLLEQALQKAIHTDGAPGLHFDRLLLTPNMDVVATFYPNNGAEAFRKNTRQFPYQTDNDYQYPNIYHMSLARLAPGFSTPATTHETNALKTQFHQLIAELAKTSKQLKQTLPHVIDMNNIKLLHNSYNRGLFGQWSELPAYTLGQGLLT